MLKGKKINRAKKNTEENRRKENTKNRNRAAAAALDVFGGILLAAVLLCCIPLTLPRLAGYEIYEVISGSMEPAIPTGSLVYVERTEPAEVEEDDVIVFYSAMETGGVITHRVVQNQVVSGQFITKGDANEQEDLAPVEYDRYIGRVRVHIPYLGAVLGRVVTVPGRIAAGCAVLAAALMILAAGRLRSAGS